MIDVHYWPTPNGKKVTILLEELGIPYNIVPVRIGVGDQFTDDPSWMLLASKFGMPDRRRGARGLSRAAGRS